MTIFDKAREKLKDNKHSIESWNILIKDAQDKRIESAREFYEELIENFPTCGRFWKIYIEHELKAKNYEHAEKLFTRSLNDVLHIDLWKAYLVYFKESRLRLNTDNYNKLVTDAYELALDKIGLDVMSYSIWLDYINFLKSLEQAEEDNNIKIMLRKSINQVYLRALKNPMINIDQMWREYCTYKAGKEDRNFPSDELSKEFQSIKRVSREYESVTRQLERHLPSLPLNKVVSFEEEMKQVQAWKRYILWEKQNPLNLDSDREIIKRVMFAYEQSFLCLAYHCDIWYEAANYLQTQSKKFPQISEISTGENLRSFYEIETANLYERAISSFMKNNVLIHLAYANFEELRSNYQKTYEIFEKCIQNPSLEEPTLAWIHYIRFARRHEDIGAARKLFRRAREDQRSTYHLFIANTNLEYFATKDKTIGFKIFQLGAKKYSNEPEYILAFLRYMSHLNEDNNTRVLFERVLSGDELPAQNMNEIWSEFLKFECGVGDLASILKVDKKRQKFFESTQTTSDWSDVILLIDRYKYMDILPCTQNELKSIGYKDIPSKQSASLNQTMIFSNKNLTQREFEMVEVNEIKKSKYPIPDVTQMLPFKPVRNAFPALHSIAGGVFPFPPAITDLVKRLPPPNTFEGPFVKIDELLEQIQSVEFHNENIMNEDFQLSYVYINGDPIKEIEYLSNAQQSIGASQLGYKRSNGNNSDDEDSKKGKTMDIYKQRQYKKLMQST